jgi:hypothetical protein
MRFSYLLVAGAVLATTAAAVPTVRPSDHPTSALPSGSPSDRLTAGLNMTVYHSPACGCCKKWVEYLKADGFTVKSIEQEDLTDIKAELGVVSKVRSCHTAVIAGYVIEGHVPTADIRRLLSEKPKVTGLAAPGMPPSSPGMDGAKQPYDVVTFDGKGATTVWARH